jgi:hypothetical protein
VTLCPLEFVREDGDRFIHRCPLCNAEARSKYRDPAMRKQQCGVARPPIGRLTPTEAAKLFPGETDPTLLGNRIAELTTALGIPPCGGCEKRKAWINKAHAWLRSLAG